MNGDSREKEKAPQDYRANVSPQFCMNEGYFLSYLTVPSQSVNITVSGECIALG